MVKLTIPDLTKYWGVTARAIELDHHSMSLKFELCWTTESKPRQSILTFLGVSKFELVSEKIYGSDIVELVSLEAVADAGGIRVEGELSNYYFSINCESIDEAETPVSCDS